MSQKPGKGKPALLCCLTCDSSDDEKLITKPPKSFDGYQFVPNEATTISFKVNGKDVTANVSDVSSNLNLARFLRENLHLTGTKISCGQGGCGACIVTASIPDQKIISVNSCLTPVLSCDGWEVTTVEGLGSRKGGLHPIQSRLASFHGTQCGFCTPGMVMQMNSLLASNPKATTEDVEHILDGNLCRCTGYRPIFDAFKTFSSDVPESLKLKLADIEDLADNNKVCCKKANSCATGRRGFFTKQSLRFVTSDNVEWYVPTTIDDVTRILDQIPQGKSHRLVGGNTGRGIYDTDTTYDVYIDIKKIPEMTSHSVGTQSLEVGAAMSLNSFIQVLESTAQLEVEMFSFAQAMANHIKKVANTGVRNGGTLAGNLMLKHAHNDFPSDLFILFESTSTKLVIRSSFGELRLSPVDFLQHDMQKSVLIKLEIPPVTSQHKFASYKITPRSENAHAYVNAACMAKIDENFVVLQQPSLLFGGISPTFFHATKTEQFLEGKSLNEVSVIIDACAILRDEVQPTADPVLASIEYRQYLPQALFYKFVLSVLGETADPKLRSGAVQIPRGLSSGQQSYETDPNLYPVNKPIPKIEGQSQCTGEAEYIDDIPKYPGELHAAFVLAAVANCDLDVVDPSSALAIPGVVAFYDHRDIAGKNSCVIYKIDEPIFSEGKIEYAGQAIGVIVAESADLAKKAALVVKITYKNRKKPVLTIKDAIQDPARIRKATEIPPLSEDYDLNADLIKVSGEFEIGSQYHFHMETQSVIVRPVEDFQYEILAACQWMDNVQIVVAQALAIPEGTIEVKVRRMGGAYGGKARPTSHVAAAAAIAASKLNKPVRLIMDLQSNMELMGKRFPYLAKYNAGVTTDGKLLYVSAIIYCDCGFTFNEATASTAAAFARNCYKAVAWNIVPSDVLTNTPSNTYCRAPGTTQGVAIIENVMDHLATALGMDPLEFRIKNMIGTSSEIVNPLPEIIPQLRASSEYDQRKKDIEQFNQNNLWKKRGIAFLPISYPFSCGGTTFYFQLSVYAADGTVAISHGGTEMGQGINTKVVQTVGKTLGIPMDIISVKPANSFISPNTSATWGSTGTDSTCTAAIVACTDLKVRMEKVAETMSNPSWLELVQECNNQGVDLTARHMGYTDRDGPGDYIIWSAVVTEVEIDVLTGEKNLRRADLIEDTGTSISPEVDVGQLEGAFVMSLGLWLTEEIKYDPETGKLLTFDTWEYKPPASHDIPEDLRTTFYDSKRNPSGVLGSKATGEPSVLMGVSALLAIRHAIAAAKKDLGEDPKAWFNLYGPATTERVQLTTGVKPEHFRL